MKQAEMIYKIHDIDNEQWIEINPDRVDEEVKKILQHSSYLKESYGSSVTISYFLLKYWMPILGGETFSFYLMMLDYAYGNRRNGMIDLKLTEMAQLCGKSSSSYARDHIRKLEKYKFTVTVTRAKRSGSSNDSNLFFILRHTPELSEDAKKQLTPLLLNSYEAELSSWHDIKSILSNDTEQPSQSHRLSKNDAQAVDNQPSQSHRLSNQPGCFVDKWTNEGEDGQSHRLSDRTGYPIQEGKEFKDLKDLKSKNIISPRDLIKNEILIKNKLQELITPVEYKTYFEHADFILTPQKLIVKCDHVQLIDWIKHHYTTKISDTLASLGYSESDIEFDT